MEAYSAQNQIIVDTLEEMQAITNTFKNDPKAEVNDLLESVLQLTVIRENFDQFMTLIRMAFPT